MAKHQPPPAHMPHAPPSSEVGEAKPARYPAAGGVSASSWRGLLSWAIPAIVLVIVGIVWFGPGYLGVRKYNQGVAAHSAGNLVTAIKCYNDSLRYDPASPLPHLNLALAILGGRVLEGIPPDQMEALVVSGAFGETTRLDSAERHLQEGLVLSQSLPPDLVLARDATGGELTSRQIIARSHITLAVTALIRGGANESARQYQWADRCVLAARQHVSSARQYEPGVPGGATLEGLLSSSGY